MNFPEINILDLIKSGALQQLPFNSSESEVISSFGIPEDVEEYKYNWKYFHYNNLRLSISDGRFVGFALYFYNYDIEYNAIINDIPLSISNSTPMTHFLFLLNEMQIKWNILYEESKLDYAFINLVSGIKIIYYLYDNKLDRINIEKQM